MERWSKMTKKPQKKDTRPVKCPYCEDKLPRGEAIRHTNGRYYHEECYEEWRGQADDRTQLIDYICELYNVKAPTGMMLMQIKRFQDEFDYKYKGMELSLRYFHELLENPVREGDGLGIIPYIYDDAKDNYVTKLSVENSIEDFDFNTKTKTINISSPISKHRKRTTKIDIESL